MSELKHYHNNIPVIIITLYEVPNMVILDFRDKMVMIKKTIKRKRKKRKPYAKVETKSELSDKFHEKIEIPFETYYRISANAWTIEKVVDGHSTWNDLFLSMRLKIKRKPDIYNKFIHGFLTNEVKDIKYFEKSITQ